MISRSPVINQLIESFRCLPGVGQKSAQRMAYYFLEKNREAGLTLATCLQQAINTVDYCQSCRLLSEHNECEICSNPNRQKEFLCIVESPADVYAIESSGMYQGLYFVLMGNLSPLDGIGPEQLGLPLLRQKIDDRHAQEIILATSATVNGEATAHYIMEMLADRNDLCISRLAHGIPLGGELEYLDSATLGHAFKGRQKMVLE